MGGSKKIDSPDSRAITVSASSRHLCSTDARITLVNRGSNGNNDIVRPSVVSCGGDPFGRERKKNFIISMKTASINIINILK